MKISLRILCQACLATLIPYGALASDAVELMASAKGNYYELTMNVKESGNQGPFVVDTGSTGIQGSAHFFGLTQDEQKQGTCQYNGYSSSGNSYAGYIINRTITLRSTKKAYTGTATISNIPVMAVVQSCPKGTKAECGVKAPKGCTNTSHVSMMGVGFGTYGQAKKTPVNPNNPFLNIDQMTNGTLPKTYLAGPATSDGLMFTLGVDPDNLPFETPHTFPLTGTDEQAGSFVGPLGKIVITTKDGSSYPTKGATLPARLLPDTGISYGIASVQDSKPPCCVDTSVSCRGSKNTFPTGTTVSYFPLTSTSKALTSIKYTSNTSGTGQCLRWSLGHTSNSALFNSGRAFFDKCALLYAPENNTMTIGCNP